VSRTGIRECHLVRTHEVTLIEKYQVHDASTLFWLTTGDL